MLKYRLKTFKHTFEILAAALLHITGVAVWKDKVEIFACYSAAALEEVGLSKVHLCLPGDVDKRQ